MAEQKKLVEEITSMDVDFAQWYTDIVKKAELIDYASVKGCMVIKPAGYALWENIQKALDDPKAKEKMNNSIKKFLDLNKLINSFEGTWPKECHFSPLFSKEFRDFLDKMTVEDYFNMLVKQILNKESKT